jgi:hypothetical protein
VNPASRTPEGEPNRCPICGKEVRLEPSRPPGDAPCPNCGHLLWFAPTEAQATDVAAIKKSSVSDWSVLLASLPDDAWSLDGLISMLVMNVGAMSGAVWLPSGTDLRVASRFHRTPISAHSPEEARCEHLMWQAAISGRKIVRPANGGTVLDHADAADADCFVYAIPVKRADRVIAVVEIDCAWAATVDDQRGCIEMLGEICDKSSGQIGRLLDADRNSATPVERARATSATTNAPTCVPVEAGAVAKKQWWQVWKK